jgi:rhamnulose-1-phosphate aldolase/alcohol dehydrogenase
MIKPIEDRWDDARAASLDEAGLLLYRSNLLGSDLRITNYGGGNTSAKINETDPLTGEPTRVLWVKGSGGDIGSMTRAGFATLYLDRLLGLERRYRGRAHEDEMVELFPQCAIGKNGVAPSIDTPLHAYLPFAHVDHVHPDSVIAIAAAKDSERLTEEIFEGRLAWLPWQRPGFDLGLKLREVARRRPGIDGIVLAGHGLFTWGATSKECYQRTLAVIRRASEWLDSKGTAPAFGGPRAAALPKERRDAVAVRLITAIRTQIAKTERKMAHFDDSPDVLELTCSERLEELARAGTSCPDHFLRTKIRPLVVPFDGRSENIDAAIAALPAAIDAYRADYAAYYERRKRPTSPPMRDPNPIIFLVPGVGMLSFARDKTTARLASEFYVNAIHVMRGATSVSEYVGLDEQEAFDIEYWLLEEAKLKRAPKPKPLTGRVAYVTGGAGGIGKATARRLMSEGASVMLGDIDTEALEGARRELAADFGADAVRMVTCDVTSEPSVARSFERAVLELGGVDIVVSNAGLASSANIEDTTLDLWNKNFAVLSTGYFLVSREAARLLKAQNRGGSIVFVASKNALAASPAASAYCAAKASEIHLARCLALELASSGVRVNVVNPDAVLRGSRIWSGGWREERARAYRISEDSLEEHYRERSMLKQNVLPEDVAEAILFFASDLSRNSTGNILNVDAGNAQAFTR